MASASLTVTQSERLGDCHSHGSGLCASCCQPGRRRPGACRARSPGHPVPSSLEPRNGAPNAEEGAPPCQPSPAGPRGSGETGQPGLWPAPSHSAGRAPPRRLRHPGGSARAVLRPQVPTSPTQQARPVGSGGCKGGSPVRQRGCPSFTEALRPWRPGEQPPARAWAEVRVRWHGRWHIQPRMAVGWSRVQHGLRPVPGAGPELSSGAGPPEPS